MVYRRQLPRLEKPLSPTSVATLKAIANGVRYGFDIIDATGLPSGTVYPALARLEMAGFLRSHWEPAAVARREKRPPRRYYQVSAAGSRALTLSIEYYRTLAGRETAHAGGLIPSPRRS